MVRINPCNKKYVRAAALAMAVCACPAWALDTAGETSQVNWRFMPDASGNPVLWAYDYDDHSKPVDITKLVPNTSTAFLGYGYDLSAVGWTAWDGNYNRQNSVLISPRHFAGAAHSPVYYGLQFDGSMMTTAVINYYSKNDTVIQGSRLGSQITLYNDASLGRLTADFNPADGLGYAAILDLGEAKSSGQYVNYIGRSVLIYGFYAELGTGTISYMNDTSIAYTTNSISVTGDSGSPTFIAYHGQLGLIGTRYYPTSDTSWCTPSMIPLINQELAKDGFAAKIIAPPTRVWTGAADTQAGALANWSINDQVNPTESLALPGSADSLGFISANANGRYAISLGGDQAAKALVFYGSDQDRVLNRPAGYVFNTGNSGFTIGTGAGDRLLLGQGGLLNEDTHTQTIAAQIKMTQGQHWSADSGGLLVTGSVDTNGYVLSVDGTQATSLLGGVSGAGRITKENSGTLILGGNNTFSGDLWVRQGKLQLRDGTTSARILLDVDSSVGIDVAGSHMVSRIDTADGSAGGDIQFLAGGKLTINNTADFTITGKVLGGVTGADVLIKQGVGTTTLAADNSYLGRTIIQSGTLAVTNIHGLGAGGIGNETILTGTGSLLLPEDFQACDEILVLQSTQAKLLFSGDNNVWSGGLSLGCVGNNTLGVDSGGSLTLGGVITSDDTTTGYKTLRLANNGIIHLNAMIKDGIGGHNKLRLSIGDGDGVVNYQSAGSFTGDVSIDRGTLSINVDRPFENASRIYLADGSLSGSIHVALLSAGAFTISNNIQVGSGNLSGQTILGGNNTSGVATFSGNVQFSGKKTLELTAAAGGIVELSGEIRDIVVMPGTIWKTGEGLVRLSHDSGNLYHGDTWVKQGTLEVHNTSGSATGFGNVTISSGAKLTGNGRISGMLTLQGTLSAGLDDGLQAGTLELAGGLTLVSGSHLEFTLGEMSDLIRVSGGSMLGPAGTQGITLDLMTSEVIIPGSYQLIDWSSAIVTGLDANDFQIGTTPLSGNFSWRVDSGGLWLDVSAPLFAMQSVPEPVSAGLLAAGGCCAMILRRRRS